MPTHNRLFSESPTFGGMQHYFHSDVKVLHLQGAVTFFICLLCLQLGYVLASQFLAAIMVINACNQLIAALHKANELPAHLSSIINVSLSINLCLMYACFTARQVLLHKSKKYANFEYTNTVLSHAAVIVG